MPGVILKQQLDVADILSKAQESTGAHVKYAGMLWSLEARDTDSCYQRLFQAVSYLVTVPQVRLWSTNQIKTYLADVDE